MSRNPLFLFALLLMAVSVASAAPLKFSGKDLSGKTHFLHDYEGKMVVVNYWATWCPPCLEELPELAVFHEQHKDSDAVVLGVDFEDISRKQLLAFLDEQMIDYPIIPMMPSPSSAFGRIIGLPTTYIVSPDQTEVKTHIGPLTMEHLDNYLKSF